MPAYHPIAGHLKTLREVMQQFPPNCTAHVPFAHLAADFPAGMYYFDLWPFSSSLIVVSTSEGAQQIQDMEHDLRKPDEIIGPIDSISGGPSLITMHGSLWKKWRGLFNPGFAPGYMLERATDMVEEVEVFCDMLRRRAGACEMFELEDLTLRLTMDIIGRLAL
jgi:sterigmatocystin biosynthesis cytochrome P450 monooxygenase